MQSRNCACGDLQRCVYYANVNPCVKKRIPLCRIFAILVHPLVQILAYLNISKRKNVPTFNLFLLLAVEAIDNIESFSY